MGTQIERYNQQTIQNHVTARIGVGNEPVGDADAAVKITRPNGVKQWEWEHVIELAVAHFRTTSGVGEITKTVLQAGDFDDRISARIWNLIFDFPHNLEILKGALAVRGVLPLGTGLSARQSLALDVVSDPSQGTLNAKLRKLGVSKNEFNKWLTHKPFAEQLKMLSKQRMNSAQPLVDMALTGAAIEGQMDAIKYFDKRTGRDPDKKEQMDSDTVVQIVLDALTKHLSENHPDLLRSIAAEIEVRMKLDGGNNS